MVKQISPKKGLKKISLTHTSSVIELVKFSTKVRHIVAIGDSCIITESAWPNKARIQLSLALSLYIPNRENHFKILLEAFVFCLGF